MAKATKSGQYLLENARVQDFIATVRAQCRKCNVKFVLANVTCIRGGEGVREGLWGFFQEPYGNTGGRSTLQHSGMLKIATKGIPVSEWLCTLAHEYAHFLQWFRGDEFYCYDTDEGYVQMEVETEREAFEILKRFGVPINYEAARRKSKKYLDKIRREEREARKSRRSGRIVR